jgi:hypothetical protein
VPRAEQSLICVATYAEEMGCVDGARAGGPAEVLHFLQGQTPALHFAEANFLPSTVADQPSAVATSL